MKMIQNEFKFIAKNKIIMISLIAIIFIPFLYSIFFLKSVWDPYGSTGNLPVAVVNNDVPTTYQGQKLSAGKDLVKELKKNDQIGWRFVSAKKAKQGLKDKEYYTVITLPKDFSANAATVLDKHPKKMQINYKTNDSLNFIAEVISEAGAKQVNAELRETVTKSYAKVMFKQVKTAGKGFTTAAKGAKKLTDGSITLSDGLNTYTAGVDKVNDGVMTMKTSVVPLSDGVKKLADGSQTLTAGLQTLNSKTGTLASGASQLNNGASQLNTGLQTLDSKTGTLASGAGQLNSGASDLSKGVNNYTNGVSSLNTGLSTLSSNSKALNDGMGSVTTGISALKDGSQKVSDGLQKMQTKINDNPTFKTTEAYNQTVAQYTALNTKIQEVKAAIPALQSSLNAIPDQIVKQTDFNAKAQAIIDSEKQAGITFTPAQEAGVKAKLSEQLAISAKDEAQQIVTGINTQIDAKKPTDAEYTQLTQAVNGSIALLGSLREIQTGLNDVGNKAGLASGSAQISSGITQLAIGSQTLSNKLATYTAGVDTATSGSNKLVSNSTALVAGGNKLAAGTSQLNGQVPALTGGIGQLANGSQQLAAGTSQLNSQVPQLTSGVSQLANGSTTLNGGLVQLNSKIPTLSNGVDQLASGTNQLAANSGQLKSGAGQLADGNKTLTSGLNAGANKVNSIKLTNSTADMFAAPSELKHSNYSYVPNYGHALAPYVLSLALFVGAIVFNFAFPIRKISMTGQSSTAWFLSKIAVGGVVAVGMGIIEPALMMAAGLNVDHPAQFFLISIMFALTSMAIIMFLSMTFDNPGRFLAMILLMLQLGGSGGTFPMQITNHFYNVIHPFLPMTYSILGFRQAITSGLGNGQVGQTVLILMLFTVVALILLWFGMNHLQKIGKAGISQLDDNQKLQDLEK